MFSIHNAPIELNKAKSYLEQLIGEIKIQISVINDAFIANELLPQLAEAINQMLSGIKPLKLKFIISHLMAIKHYLIFKSGESVFKENAVKTFENIIAKGSEVLAELTGINEEEIIYPNQDAGLIQKNLVTDASVIEQPDNDAQEKRCIQEQRSLDGSVSFERLLRKLWIEAIKQGHASKRIFISYAWPIQNEDNEQDTAQFIQTLVSHLICSGMQVFLDKLHSGEGYPLGNFMQKIHKVDHVLVISTKIMAKKLLLKESGIFYEYTQIMNCLSKDPTLWEKRFVIPLLFNNRKYCHKDFSKLAELSFSQHGYYYCFEKLLHRLYRFGYSLDSSINLLFKEYLTGLCVEKLNQLYLTDKYSLITPLLSSEINGMPSLKISDCFVSVSMIKEERQRENELASVRMNASNSASPNQQNNNVFNKDVPFNLLDVMKNHDAGTGTQVLILAPGGMGKSTLCQSVLHQSTKQDSIFATRYKAVLWVKCRDLRKKKEYETFDEVILQASISANGQNNRYYNIYLNLIKQHSDEILFLVDGLNEIPSALKEKNSSGNRDIDYLLGKKHTIVTTRPMGNLDDFQNHIKLQLIGFDDNNIVTYTNNFFKRRQELATNVNGLLNSNALVKSLAAVPINLELICSVWEEELSLRNNITITKIFSTITYSLFKRYLKFQGNILSDIPLATIEFELTYLLYYLEEVAFTAFQANEIYLSELLLSNAIHCVDERYPDHKRQLRYLLLSDLSTQIKLLQVHCGFLRAADNTRYSIFLHPTVEDFMVARYIYRLVKSGNSAKGIFYRKKNLSIKEYFGLQKYNSRHLQIWQFLAGLCAEEQSTLHGFLENLVTFPKDIFGGYEMPLLISCMEEILQQFPSQLPQYLDENVNYRIIINFIKTFLFGHNEKSCPVHFERMQYARRYQLSSELPTPISHLYGVLKRAKTCLKQSQIILALQAALKSQNSQLQIHAMNVIENLGLVETLNNYRPADLISLLFMCLGSKNIEVKILSARLLNKIPLTSEQQLRIFNELFSDENCEIKEEALKMLHDFSITFTDELSYMLSSLIINEEEPTKIRELAAKLFGDKLTFDEFLPNIASDNEISDFLSSTDVHPCIRAITLGKLLRSLPLNTYAESFVNGFIPIILNSDTTLKIMFCFILASIFKDTQLATVLPSLALTLVNSLLESSTNDGMQILYMLGTALEKLPHLDYIVEIINQAKEREKARIQSVINHRRLHTNQNDEHRTDSTRATIQNTLLPFANFMALHPIPSGVRAGMRSYPIPATSNLSTVPGMDAVLGAFMTKLLGEKQASLLLLMEDNRLMLYEEESLKPIRCEREVKQNSIKKLTDRRKMYGHITLVNEDDLAKINDFEDNEESTSPSVAGDFLANLLRWCRSQFKLLLHSYDEQLYFQPITQEEDSILNYSPVCGSRDEAYQLIKSSLSDSQKLLVITKILKPAIEEALLTTQFRFYLFTRSINIQTITEGNLASNVKIVEAYIDFDVLRKQVKGGHSHPSILLVVAWLKNTRLYLWKISNLGNNVEPFFENLESYQPSLSNQFRIDLLIDENYKYSELLMCPDSTRSPKELYDSKLKEVFDRFTPVMLEADKMLSIYDIDTAILCYEAIVRKVSGFGDIDELFDLFQQAFLELGCCYEIQAVLQERPELVSKAEDCFKQSLQHPYSLKQTTCIKYANFLYSGDRYLESIKWLLKAIALDNQIDNVQVCYLLIYPNCYFGFLPIPKKPWEKLDTISIQPSAYAYYLLIRIFIEIDKKELALYFTFEFENAIKENHSAFCYCLLAKICKKLGFYKKAADYFDYAYNLDNTCDYAKQKRDDYLNKIDMDENLDRLNQLTILDVNTHLDSILKMEDDKSNSMVSAEIVESKGVASNIECDDDNNTNDSSKNLNRLKRERSDSSYPSSDFFQEKRRSDNRLQVNSSAMRVDDDNDDDDIDKAKNLSLEALPILDQAQRNQTQELNEENFRIGIQNSLQPTVNSSSTSITGSSNSTAIPSRNNFADDDDDVDDKLIAKLK